MDSWIVIALVLGILFVLFLCWELYRNFVRIQELEESEVFSRLVTNKNKTLIADNAALRREIRTYKTEKPEGFDTEFRSLADFIDDIPVDGGEAPNPQHFRPMFDSQGLIFDPLPPIEAVDAQPAVVAVEPEEEALGYESGQGVGPEPVPDGEETTNGVLRSGSVSGV